MAARRPARDLLPDVLGDTSDSNEDALTENQARTALVGNDPHAQIPRIHPSTSDFGPLTLGQYLQDNIRATEAREEQLKANLLLAAADAEMQRLRNIVNTNKPITAAIVDGRLLLFDSRSAARRSHSAPPSEGDSESSRPRYRSVSGSGTTKPTILDSMPFWKPQKRRAQPSQANRRSQHPNQLSNTPSPFEQSILNQSAELFGNNVLPKYTDENQEPSSSIRPNRLVPVDLRVPDGVDPQVPFQSDSRSRSFQKHTDVVRNSTRFSKPEIESSIPLNNDNQSPAESDESRPRKTAIGTSTSTGHGHALTVSSNIPLIDNQALLGKSKINESLLKEKGVVGSCTSLDKGRDDFVDDHQADSYVKQNTAGGETASSSKRSSSASDYQVHNDAPVKLGRKKKPLTGMDTFYSESSEQSCISDQGEDVQFNTNRLNEAEQLDEHENVNQNNAKCMGPSAFVYDTIVPEILPTEVNQAKDNCERIWSLVGFDESDKMRTNRIVPLLNTQVNLQDFDPNGLNILGAANQYGEYPRKWKARRPPKTQYDPPICLPNVAKDGFPPEILQLTVYYLSSYELRQLRLVNRSTAAILLPMMIRSTVFEFGPALFDAPDQSEWDSTSIYPSPRSLIQTCGSGINKFGISFKFDPLGLASAEPKVIEKMVHAWFGSYIWPEEKYPRFPQLKALEDLVDNGRPLLKNTFRSLTEVHELALSVDSGHGWLNGPDISDLAIWREKKINGPKVFGQHFDAPDKIGEYSLRQFFRWGQLNTLNAYAKRLASNREGTIMARVDKKFLQRLKIRSYDDYLIQTKQPDFHRATHTGETAASTSVQQPAAHVGPAQPSQAVPPPVTNAAALNVNNLQAFPPLPQLAPTPAANAATPNVNNAHALPPLGLAPLLQLAWTPTVPNVATMLANAANVQANTFAAGITTGTVQVGGPPQISNQNGLQLPTLAQPILILPGSQVTQLPAPANPPTAQPVMTGPQGRRAAFRSSRPRTADALLARIPVIPQWPLLFNGYNIAAEMGGRHSSVQANVARPYDYPFMPGDLTEPQVQWLMETLWAQRAFLSAYTNSIITNAKVFENVHSLHIATLSSGLIPYLAHDEFWASLPELKNLTLKISPDWRQEHIPGDKFYHRHMPISPVQASEKLADLLRNTIAKLEKLSTLTVGFIGGGEHQTGIFARNRHVLPAPITSDPEAWVTDHLTAPDPQTMFVFNHIRDLTFENCWFSPCMLEAFMKMSRDTSLHHLTLESVSLTGVHHVRSNATGPFMADMDQLKCEFSPGEWLQEIVPSNACWVNVLEKITPGKTILERKYEAEMIDEEEYPQPERGFRGNIQKITLKSCGYVRISASRPFGFVQDGLVVHANHWNAMDGGLEMRKRLFNTNLLETVRATLDWNYSAIPRRSSDSKKSKSGIMMSIIDPETQQEYFGLGKLTQCIHPIEKRVLERAWDMRFGWGDNMDRFAAVEDGWFEGGTGRFSGTIVRDNE